MRRIFQLISLLLLTTIGCCKNAPKTAVTIAFDKEYLWIPSISSDSLLLFGNTSDNDIYDFFNINQILRPTKKEIIQAEKIIRKEIQSYYSYHQSIIRKQRMIELLNNKEVSRQYMFGKDALENKKMIIVLWDKNYNQITKEIYEKFYNKNIYTFLCIYDTRFIPQVLSFEVNLSTNKIIKVR